MKAPRKFFITLFLHSKLNVLMKIFAKMEKVFQVRKFKNGINVMNKSFHKLLECAVP